MSKYQREIGIKMRDMFKVVVGVLFLTVVACAPAGKMVEEGSQIKIQYALEADGQVMIDSKNPQQLDVKVGQHKLPPAYEQALIGLHVGEEKVIRLEPSQAFGPIRPELFIRISRETIGQDVSVGSRVSVKNQAGQPVNLRVIKVLEDSVVLDRNHPLAGKNLVYRVKIMEIN